MKIDGTAPAQGSDGGRFQAAKPTTAKEGGMSFGAVLKKASEAKPAAAPVIGSAAAPASPAPADAKVPRDDAQDQETETGPAGTAGSPDFASHMEMVKMRLKSGYYNNTNVNDALSEKLTGFFDDLA